jgi:hypothetical protein
MMNSRRKYLLVCVRLALTGRFGIGIALGCFGCGSLIQPRWFGACLVALIQLPTLRRAEHPENGFAFCGALSCARESRLDRSVTLGKMRTPARLSLGFGIACGRCEANRVGGGRQCYIRHRSGRHQHLNSKGQALAGSRSMTGSSATTRAARSGRASTAEASNS